MTRLLITYPMCAKLIREIIIIAAEVLLEQLWKRACSIKLYSSINYGYVVMANF